MDKIEIDNEKKFVGVHAEKNWMAIEKGFNKYKVIVEDLKLHTYNNDTIHCNEYDLERLINSMIDNELMCL